MNFVIYTQTLIHNRFIYNLNRYVKNKSTEFRTIEK